jgi:hypothetical protein
MLFKMRLGDFSLFELRTPDKGNLGLALVSAHYSLRPSLAFTKPREFPYFPGSTGLSDA